MSRYVIGRAWTVDDSCAVVFRYGTEHGAFVSTKRKTLRLKK